jgi:hypothetical protein
LLFFGILNPRRAKSMCDEKNYKSDSELEVGSDLDILLNVYLE